MSKSIEAIGERNLERFKDAWKALAGGPNPDKQVVFVCRYEHKGDSAIYVATIFEYVIIEAATIIATTLQNWLKETPESPDYPYEEEPRLRMRAILDKFDNAYFRDVVSMYMSCDDSVPVMGEYTDMWMDIYEDCEVH